MKIGLITDSIEMGSPGLRRYSMRLAEEMTRLLPGEVTLVHRGVGTDSFYTGKATLKVWNPRLPFAGKQVMFRLKARNHHFDVLHDTYHFPPFIVPWPAAKVMTIADLTAVLMPTHTWKNRAAHRLFLPALARRADHIVTISEHTRRDVIEILKIDPARVTATPLAADGHLRPVEDSERLASVRARYGLPQRFFVYVGTLEPRKNLGRVLEAFAQIAGQFPDVGLVLAGSRGWGGDDLGTRARDLGLKGRVALPGRITEDDLAALYSAAIACVFPSLYEGFGLPPLEAMQCGCPVITSNASSLPEVAGDAAIMVDPLSVDQIAAAMRDVASKAQLAAGMRARGLAQATRFSWRRCAELTLGAYERALDSRRPGASRQKAA